MKMTSYREKSLLMLEVSFFTGILRAVAGVPYKIATENVVFELLVLHNAVLTVVSSDGAALLTVP